ncbi:hypothetical protein KQ313_14410 [Synechococcus sp. CS-1325]|uniref:hypothetical protein n=1 Tax=Synechococcus sp. CS-1325 TaxID=2847979 RepID=UPI00223ADA41|nr:hypothetical protein [Synechococcus sp. CS-1325]MCT0200862.1 hypothetical protein [Synechococcus sp. CS-1325]
MDRRATALSEAREQLQRMQQRLEQSNAALVHELTLYFQVLREGLPMAVQQAAFHVATQLVPERYGSLEEGRRQELQRRLRELVERCGSLLTLEQLIVLGRQVQSEQKRLHRREQQRLIAALTDQPEQDSSGDDPASQGPLPPGSVRLGLDLPLSADLFSAGLPGLAGLAALGLSPAGKPPPTGIEADPDDLAAAADHRAEASPEAGGAEADTGDCAEEAGDQDDETATEAGESGEAGEAGDEEEMEEMEETEDMQMDEEEDAPGDLGAGRLDALRSNQGLQQLFAMASEQFGRDATREEDEEQELPADPEDGASPVVLPDQPIALLRWWEVLDRALQRRLRNLSHAINLDLLRLGLTRSLLPINLLDAVLDGQIEAMPAPANLLRLSLPFAPEAMAGQLEAIGLLLRSSDLEFDQARLRTCRRRLEQRRQDVRKMARQYRHWQRRTQALEAEQQWLQDSQTNLPAPP